MIRWTHPDLPLLANYILRDRYVQDEFVSHEDHEINLILAGRVAYRFENDLRIELQPGDILAMPGGCLHAMDTPEPFHIGALHIHPLQFKSLEVTAEFQPLVKKLSTWKDPLPPRKLLSPGTHAVLKKIIEEVMIEQNQPLPAYEEMLQLLMTQTTIHFLRLMAFETSCTEPDETLRRILGVRDWMDRNFVESISLKELGQRAHLAPTYFAAQFHSIVGQAPMTYIRNRRISQAKLLLRQTQQPVKSVALSVGFGSVNRFNHLFKKATGLTPLEYRRRDQKHLKER